MQHPLLYEVNARAWLRELSQTHQRKITLGSIPAAELERLQKLGFSHLWLMGVWSVGPRSRDFALTNPFARQTYDQFAPGWKEEEVEGSPYAISAFTVPRHLGGEAGLKKFREQLREHGIRLILDAVCNHVGLDHSWLREHPEFFVRSSTAMPETFPADSGKEWIAHGKDPNFPAWADTAQLDYRQAGTRAAMIQALEEIALRCDGVRCDMAMLLLNDVFIQTWQNFPAQSPPVMTEFWSEAISQVRKKDPDFVFLAEVYWNLEDRLKELGFDFTYDKTVYDLLIQRDYPQLQRHLYQQSLESLWRSAHFLENHDEARAASVLSLEEHQAAALLVTGLPGMRMLHHGQLTGRRSRAPIQVTCPSNEAPDAALTSFYERLLNALQPTCVGRAKATLLKPRPAWPGNPSSDNFIVVQWQSDSEPFDLVVVNLADHRSQCYAPVSVRDLARHNWEMRDLLGGEQHERYGDDLENNGLYLDLPAHGAQLFHFQPIR